jgi:hypothetical protein
MYFVDLGDTTQIAVGDHVRAVGWLAGSMPYVQGQVSAECIARIEQYARLWEASTRALKWAATCGPHTCEFCGQFHAGGNFGVPSNGLLYVCPDMIAHYVRVHEYLPPQEFIDAVLVAPLPGTEDYDEVVAPFRRGPA